MRKSLSLSLFTLLFILSIYSCKEKAAEVIEEQSTPAKVEPKIVDAPGFVHAVYFWLNDDNPELLKEFKEKGLPILAKVPSIKSVAWGPPAGTPREVVDNSYDLAWIVTFENAEEQDKYQVDPIHLEFVEKYKSLFKKVQVYDNIVTNYAN